MLYIHIIFLFFPPITVLAHQMTVIFMMRNLIIGSVCRDITHKLRLSINSFPHIRGDKKIQRPTVERLTVGYRFLTPDISGVRNFLSFLCSVGNPSELKFFIFMEIYDTLF